MRKEDLELFTQAFQAVLQEIGFTKISYQSSDNIHIPCELLASIGITGDIQGFLLLRSSLDSMRSFIGKVLENMGMEQEEDGFGKFYREAFGEILNQLSGRAMMQLSDNGFDCDITPPTILIGSNITYDLTELDSYINNDIQGDFGDINIFVGIKKTNK